MIATALALVRRFVAGYSPSPPCVMLAGSRGRGTAKKNSDYDLVFLYPELPQGAWREMISYEGADLEIFAHDLRSLQYFLREIERPSGEASLACMVAEGISIHSANSELESKAKDIAREFLASGPEPLDDAKSSQRRYAITDLAEMLNSADSPAQRIAIGSALYSALGGFALSANGRWMASGKALPPALRHFSPSLELEFTEAFENLYASGNDSLLQKLVDDILKPFGGRLRGGFRQQAPASWR
ncbi:MAG: nucleotidyltransferase domain-containing protein [Edaphobacter sp.]